MTTHIDIAPTLLELAGLAGKPDARGQSLVPLIRGKRRTAHPFVFGEEDVLEPLRSVRDVRFKLILNLRTGAKQLFDVWSIDTYEETIARMNKVQHRRVQPEGRRGQLPCQQLC